MIIPPEKLSKDVLQAVIESYVMREGTDYGEHEFSLHDKVEQLRAQLERGEVLISFDSESESLTLFPRDDYYRIAAQHPAPDAI